MQIPFMQHLYAAFAETSGGLYQSAPFHLWPRAKAKGSGREAGQSVQSDQAAAKGRQVQVAEAELFAANVLPFESIRLLDDGPSRDCPGATLTPRWNRARRPPARSNGKNILDRAPADLEPTRF
jgi:hypothetical protein